MKKIICLLSVILITTSCSKDELEEQSLENIPNLENKTITAATDEGESTIYLDMAFIESSYTGPSYSGSFRIHYRNLMSTHFTINDIEFPEPDCMIKNVEKWNVNSYELNLYLNSSPSLWYISDTSGIVVNTSVPGSGSNPGTNNPPNNSNPGSSNPDDGTDPATGLINGGIGDNTQGPGSGSQLPPPPPPAPVVAPTHIITVQPLYGNLIFNVNCFNN